MNKRTFKRVQKLHNEGIGLEQSISLMISFSQFDDDHSEIAGNIIKLIHDHLIHPPTTMYATDGGLRLVDLIHEHGEVIDYDSKHK